jgi:hypothetical protein
VLDEADVIGPRVVTMVSYVSGSAGGAASGDGEAAVCDVSGSIGASANADVIGRGVIGKNRMMATARGRRDGKKRDMTCSPREARTGGALGLRLRFATEGREVEGKGVALT